MFLVFNLPDILSESDRKLSWIKYIGLNIINKISISIGGNLIDEQYSEWMFIWNEISLPAEKKDLYYKLIGHEKELYDPGMAYNRNSFYPESGLIILDSDFNARLLAPKACRPLLPLSIKASIASCNIRFSLWIIIAGAYILSKRAKRLLRVITRL